ncbi:MAG: paraquat-inducible protein A [Planctomycetota bacterium]
MAAIDAQSPDGRSPAPVMRVRPALVACHACGLIQRLPTLRPDQRARCRRCRQALRRRARPNAAARCAALSATALVLYYPAMTEPVLQIQRFGYTTESTILDGASALIAEGSVGVGLIVLVCSIVAPVAKLLALLAISAGSLVPGAAHRALLYRVVEWIGRWGMLDVLLVAMLVAAVKLGSWAEVTAGPGAFAFAGVVVFSILASAAFDPHAIWRLQRTGEGGGR